MIHITIEGLDGTGKSTLIKALHDALLFDTDLTRWVYATKEPGLTVKAMAGLEFNRPGIDVREIVLNDISLTPFERELLFYVDASQHRKFINDQNGAIVLTDRGLWTHLSYLRATLKTGQLDYQQYEICKDVIDQVCPVPTFIVYLRGSLALMKERNRDKKKDLIESNGEDFFGYVLETYEDLAFENSKCLILDANDSTCKNVELVVKSLKERFTYEQLQSGNF